MMMAAIETCSSAMPSARMPISENITANGTIIAAMSPARRPEKDHDETLRRRRRSAPRSTGRS